MIHRIHIPDGASTADPEHLIKYWEIVDGNAVQHSTFQPLLDLIQELELKDAEARGFREGIAEVLETLGMTFSEYNEAYKAKKQKEKDAIDKLSNS